MFSRFKQNAGQASVEAALLFPVILMIIALLVEPVCILYTKTVMDGACAEGLRVATTSSDAELIESYILRLYQRYLYFIRVEMRTGISLLIKKKTMS